MAKIRKAVIPAAGFGTRMLPATKVVPKEMLPILNKPCLQYIVEEAVHAGIEEILIITSRNKRAIEDYFDRAPELELHLEKNRKPRMLTEVKAISELANVNYIRQKSALGLGHAILGAKSFIDNEPFAVLLGDDVIQSTVPVTKQLIDAYSDETSALVGVQSIPQKDVCRYGIIEPATSQPGSKIISVKRVVEKPSVSEAPSTLAILGRYILPPSIFGILEQIPFGNGGELQLTDAIQRLAIDGRATAFCFEGLRHDIGNLEGWLKANISFAMTNPHLAGSVLSQLEILSKRVVGI